MLRTKRATSDGQNYAPLSGPELPIVQGSEGVRPPTVLVQALRTSVNGLRHVGVRGFGFRVQGLMFLV